MDLNSRMQISDLFGLDSPADNAQAQIQRVEDKSRFAILKAERNGTEGKGRITTTPLPPGLPLEKINEIRKGLKANETITRFNEDTGNYEISEAAKKSLKQASGLKSLPELKNPITGASYKAKVFKDEEFESRITGLFVRQLASLSQQIKSKDKKNEIERDHFKATQYVPKNLTKKIVTPESSTTEKSLTVRGVFTQAAFKRDKASDRIESENAAREDRKELEKKIVKGDDLKRDMRNAELVNSYENKKDQGLTAVPYEVPLDQGKNQFENKQQKHDEGIGKAPRPPLPKHKDEGISKSPKAA